MKKRTLFVLIALMAAIVQARGHSDTVRRAVPENPGTGLILGLDADLDRLPPFIQSLGLFARYIPQEKVYLHFDNTSYYQDDRIWFKCYVTSTRHRLSDLSKTLYVELLNPGGEIVDKRVLKIENGQCHGDFALKQLPFYSGFYEVRAYTRYMLNFGNEGIFSRLLPVFDKPDTEGDFQEKEMLRYSRYGAGGYPMKRPKPEKGKAVNIRFFPEGGHLVQGIESRVAFEATDEAGNPVDVAGVVMQDRKEESGRFSAWHEGKGMFAYTPGTGRQEAVVEYAGRTHRFELPTALPQGVILEVDNLSWPDSIGITVQKSAGVPDEYFGVVLLHDCSLQNYLFVHIPDDRSIGFRMDKTELPPGISRIVLFNGDGEALCDRQIFIPPEDMLEIGVNGTKAVYAPYEAIELELSIPEQAAFSLAVRDGANEVQSGHNILTDLLLMSEIRGFVRNPAYYFEADDSTRRAALDLLLMVQGWRRISWGQMAGTEPVEIGYLPEQGIETRGKVVSLTRQRPRPNVDVSLMLTNREQELSAVDTYVTDEQGRFSFVSGVTGQWDMLLSVKEKGKAKDHLILLDRIFSPPPGPYRYAELQIGLRSDADETEGREDEEADSLPEEDTEALLAAYLDSLAGLGMEEKLHRIDEVTVTARKRRSEHDIYHNRSTSIAYYDVPSETDDIYDRGEYIGDDIHQMLVHTNPEFTIRQFGRWEMLLYKGKIVLFVVDYKPVNWNSELSYFEYKGIRLPAIRSMYVNETFSARAQYVYVPGGLPSPHELAEMFNCVVFIETYPDGDIPAQAAKGLRKTRLEGYNLPTEFYSPDYSILPPAADYRRTLYWNPSVTPDQDGHATVRFYNNGTPTRLSISAETVTGQGKAGMYRAAPL